MKTKTSSYIFNTISSRYFCLTVYALFFSSSILISQNRIVDTASYARMPEFDLKESSAFSSSEIFKLRVKSDDLKEFLSLVDLLEEVKELKLVVDNSDIALSELFLSLERMKSLEVLNITINIPGPIPPEIGNLKNLKKLYISGKKITDLPSEIGNLDNLEVLGLENLKVTTVPTVFGKLKKLKTLYIYGISALDISPFSACEQITEIHLHSNNLTKLPEAVLKFNNLQRFCSEENPEMDYDHAFSLMAHLPHLQFLQLKNNKLKAIPASISQIQTLCSLDLSSNLFTQFPAEILPSGNLQQLYLRENMLTSLPDDFMQLKKLTYLDLSGNKFSSLPSVLVKMPALTSLIMDRNSISDLGPDAAKMVQLRVFSLLEDKKLDPGAALSTLCQLPNLEDLSLGGVISSTLSPDIGKFKKLTSLELTLGLKSLTNELFSISTLEELYLNENALETLPDGIRSLQNLRIIDLSGNSIHDFPKMLIKLPALEDLVLADNDVASMTDYGQEAGAGHLSGFKHLKYLDLSGNNKLISSDIQTLIGDLPLFKMCISDVYIEYRSESERAYKLGNDKLNQKDYPAALLAFSKAIELNPFMAEAYSARGQLKYFQNHDNNGALQDLTQAISNDSSRSDAFTYRGVVRAAMNDFKGAVLDCNKAISLNDNDENSYVNRASIEYAQLHDIKASIADYTKAIALNSKEPSYYTTRGKIRYENGERNAACEDWKKASELGDMEGALLLKKYCK